MRGLFKVNDKDTRKMYDINYDNFELTSKL